MHKIYDNYNISELLGLINSIQIQMNRQLKKIKKIMNNMEVH